MRGLRYICNQKHIFTSLKTPYRLSSQTLQPTCFSRHFRATASSLVATQKAWTLFNPIPSAALDTHKLKEHQQTPSSDPDSQSQHGLSDSSPEKRAYGETFSIGEFSGNIKKGKVKNVWVCSSCGYSDGQWWGLCRSCDAPGTMTMTECSAAANSKLTRDVRGSDSKAWLPKEESILPVRLKEVNRGFGSRNWRISLPGMFGAEINTVLGGGLVPGSLVLVGGDPGVGKSTLLLQMAALISGSSKSGRAGPVVYVSGEESIEQIGDRADRLEIVGDELFLYSSTDIEDIINKAQVIAPQALIIDSIQTVYLNSVIGAAGGIAQVKACTMTLLRFAKKTGIPVLLAGHVTKSGEIAGPRLLEHIVDAVLYLEGDKWSFHRLLRSIKNRFGSTDELGVFKMSQRGLQAVVNSSEIFLSEAHSRSDILAGLAVTVIMDGSRFFLLEIQALCAAGSVISRQVNGVPGSRADMIISVLIKQAGLKLQQNAIFLNVVSGMTLTETAGDLAIAAAICSSFLEVPIPNNIAFIGEIGLAGELRTVPRTEKRIQTVAKLGYKKCIVPKAAETLFTMPTVEGMLVIGCHTLKDLINIVFASHKS